MDLIRTSSTPLRDAILAGLSRWKWLLENSSGGESAWIGRVIQEAAPTPDAWLREFHRVLAQSEAEALTYTKSVDTGNQRSLDLILLADSLSNQHLPELARAVLRRAWRQHPGDFEVNVRLGGVAPWAPAQINEALRHLTAAVAIRPYNAGAYLNLGVALKEQGKLEVAIAMHRKAIEWEPEYASAHLNLGVALEAQGDMEEAIKAFRRAIELRFVALFFSDPPWHFVQPALCRQCDAEAHVFP